MNHPHALPDWNTLATLGDDELPLLGTALLIARDEYPDLDPAGYSAQVDTYADALRPQLEGDVDLPARLTAINRYLFEEVGFAGNNHQYDDPRNSYLNQVVDRKLGIPISLAVIQIEVTRRLGMPLDGVSFPGHFLVRLPVDDGILVLDPFNKGRPVSAEELRERASPHLGGQPPDDQQLLQILAPATHRMILMRMLRNLKGVYAEKEDFERALRCSDRLLMLDPALPDEYRDRGLLYLRVGHLPAAREDLARYLRLSPDAGDADEIRDALLDASRGATVIH